MVADGRWGCGQQGKEEREAGTDPVVAVCNCGCGCGDVATWRLRGMVTEEEVVVV